VGSERLSPLARAIGVAFAASFIACSNSPARPRPVTAPQAQGRHLQIVHAMTTPARRALVERLRARNPAPPESQWTVNEEALGINLMVVDPFAGFVRRARRKVAPRPARAGGPVGTEEAANAARAFVKKNSDLLGLPRHVVPALDEHVRVVEPSDHAAPRASWVVRFEAPFPSKGYEGFKEIDNVADVAVVIDDDGEVSSFVNLSRVHPHLALDTKPRLSRDDPRVMSKLVGRKVFALEPREGGTEATEAPRDVRELRRIALGEVRPEDVTHMQLVIHVSTGPELAWLTYRLGYFVEVGKSSPLMGFDGLADGPPQYFFFRYVVDADTGDVLEDARAPFTALIESGQ
jgi:hypothetical protein